MRKYELLYIVSLVQHMTQFLTSLNLMDYSLLVGIHDCDHGDGKIVVEDGFDSEDNGIDNDDDLDCAEAVGRLDVTPPDSPSRKPSSTDPEGFTTVDPDTDVYAIRCSPRTFRRQCLRRGSL